MRAGVVDPEEALKQLERGAAKEDGEREEVPAVTTIEIDVKDARGKRYVGRFYYSVPTLGDQIKIGQVKAVMLPQGSPADVNAAVLVDMLAYLQVTLTFNEHYPKPSWWNPTKLYDAAPFDALYRRCLDHEAAFHGRGPQHRGDEAGADESEGRDRGGEVSVGRKVPPPAQRRETLAGDGS